MRLSLNEVVESVQLTDAHALKRSFRREEFDSGQKLLTHWSEEIVRLFSHETIICWFLPNCFLAMHLI